MNTEELGGVNLTKDNDVNRPLTVDEYVEKSGVDVGQLYEKDEATDIINENVIALYKGRISLNCDFPMSGVEIATKLNEFHVWFHNAFDEAWKKEIPDEQV